MFFQQATYIICCFPIAYNHFGFIAITNHQNFKNKISSIILYWRNK